MKNTLTFLLFGLLSTCTLFANTIVVSQAIGYNATDATPFLQTAISDTNADTVIIDHIGSDWITAPLFVNRSNLVLILEDGVTMIAKAGAFDVFDPLIRIVDQSNITILGYGATMKMRKAEYTSLDDSEYRHVISLQSAINIRIEGLRLEDSGGDGLYIGNSFRPDSPQNYCENIVVRNCFMTNNYRQGISIISVRDALIEYCEISETKGTLPEAGIDIEPDNPSHRIENLTIRGCKIFDNYGQAIQFAFPFVDDSSLDVSIVMEDTYIANNHDPSNEYAYTEMAFTDNYGNGIDGTVTLRNCYVAESQWGAIFIEKTVESFDVFIENCVFKDVSQNPIAFNAPIFVEVKNNAIPFGGVTFTDCTIIYEADIPFLDSYADPGTAGFADINGDFFVVNPNTVGFAFNGNTSNITIQPTYFSQVPPITAEIQSVVLKNSEDLNFLDLEVNAATSISPFPIALEYNFSGSSTIGEDYYLLPRYEILAKNATSVSSQIKYRKEEKVEGVEEMQISLIDEDCYSLSAENIGVIEVSDTGLKALKLLTPNSSISTVETENALLPDTFATHMATKLMSTHNAVANVRLYPNPASTILHFEVAENRTIQFVKVFDSYGRIVIQEQPSRNSLNISQLVNGIYTVQFYLGENEIRTAQYQIMVFKE